MGGTTPRRAYVASAAAYALLLASGAPATALAARGARIDAHAHVLLPRYRAALRGAGVRAPGGLPFPAWSEGRALSFMARYGIRAQVVSISDPGVSFLSGDAASALARGLNDDLADLLRRRPDRFAALAVLPLPDVEASIAEVRRALDELGLDGIGLLTSYAGRYLGDPALRPLLAELDARRAYVFVHPTVVADDDKPALGLPDPVVEFPFETTRTVDSLARAGVFTAFPRIRWHLAHAGGLVPALLGRLTRDAPAGTREALTVLRYDTALSASVPAMTAVRELVDVAQILFATDWPFTTALFALAGTPQPGLARSFGPGELDGVLGANILRELPRLAAAIERADA